MRTPVRARETRRGLVPVAMLGLAAALALAGLSSCAAPPDSARTPPPQARVVQGGDGGALPRAEPQVEQMDIAPLEAAWSAARAQGAQALLVVRHGHLLFERYGSAADGQARFDGGPMSAMVLALLAGVVRAGHPVAAGDTPPSDLAALQASVVREGQGSLEEVLSRQLWRPLDADTAWYLPASDGASRADCCLHARAVDWLRIGLLLLDHGRDRGEQRVPADWVDAMLRPVAGDPARGLVVRLAPRGYAVRNLVWVPGAGKTRLWLSPALQLAVLRIDNAPASVAGSDDHGGVDWLDPLLRAVRDRGQSPDATDLLNQLVPGH